MSYSKGNNNIIPVYDHCILLLVFLFRGHNFKDYSKLGTLSSVFPKANIVAMTATATNDYQKAIIQSLNMKDPKLVVANPDRANIFL